ncbi:hypothetical protein IGI04_026032 [Brassica rapa subsp. trilocularis]|uniref:Uncharacterized protein n=1 Tax=Brassica rapa subsp. trilocularis TaxID=1813537 RepID=A0ABQ7KXJ5_BRACM|nr:hypothetical protein IGI04_026032 [Brassica rapa subsp. trilocularis]
MKAVLCIVKLNLLHNMSDTFGAAGKPNLEKDMHHLHIVLDAFPERPSSSFDYRNDDRSCQIGNGEALADGDEGQRAPVNTRVMTGT